MSSFFVFPLSLLAMQLEEKDILQHAISHALMRAGDGTSADTIDDERIEDFVKKHGGEKKIGYRKSNAHDQAVRGCIACNVAPGWLPNTLKSDSAVNEFVRKHEAVHGAGPLVFVGADLLWECFKGEFKWKDFTTICAVNSIIGRKKTPVLIRRSLIAARQMGYKTPAVMNMELPKLDPKKPHREPLTVKELRSCLDRLETRKLLVRCQVGMRRVYFGKGITREELRVLLAGLMSGKPSLQSIRAEDRKLFSGQGPLNKKEEEKGPLNKERAKEGPQEGPKEGPREGPLKEQLLNNSLLNNSLLKNSVLNNAVLPAPPESTMVVSEEIPDEELPPSDCDEVLAKMISALREP